LTDALFSNQYGGVRRRETANVAQHGTVQADNDASTLAILSGSKGSRSAKSAAKLAGSVVHSFDYAGQL
jgi:hypothetical protein